MLPGAAIMRLMRLLWNLLGFAMVGTGLVGIAVPGMPSTIFFILALAAFTKGANEKWRRKLLDHKIIGPTLTHWERHRSISRRIKWVACLSIVVFCGLSMFAIRKPWVKAVVGGLGLAGIGYIVTRRNTEDIEEFSGAHPGVPAADQLGA